MEKDEWQNVNLTLADVVKSKNLRLWEGFPILLANSVEKGVFDYNKVNSYLNKASDKHYLTLLIAMSLALYKVLSLKFVWASKLYKALSDDYKKEVSFLYERLLKEENIKIDNYIVSSQRIKHTFNNYFKTKQVEFKDLLSLKDEYSLEYSLSQLFSPKQKELFLKKLRKEKLSKTEREYFSRVVKKKLLALANSELHRLAQKLLLE
ncbi:MAG: hypothetical protein KAJ14_05600 [Candidatus Omnitrophica bacterium]|nr:hypothetical protein [Candidatus Omnitrophota bacterium]